MNRMRFSRRDVLKSSSALVASTVFASPLKAAPPEPSAITPELVAAAKKEGKVVYYTATDLPVAEKFARAFEAKFPGISVRVERSGSERLFQRIAQEQASRVYAVDVINSADAAHFISWKRDGWLAPHVPEDVAKHFPPEHKDADGLYASMRCGLIVIGYNTNLVKREDAPKSFADLLDPKWFGKIIKGHPSYSGAVLTATHQISRDLGWEFFEKLAKQKVMQVQSGNDPPKKLALGERAVMADGNEYTALQIKEAGQPLELVYPTEGTPFVVGPSGVFKSAPNPNAARLFQNFAFTAEAQQLLVDVGAFRSAHALVREQPDRTPLRSIKLMKEDAVAVEKQSEELKARYARIFKV